MSSEQRVLVTGGAGFIGSHLVDYLVQKSFCVDIVDDLSRGSRRNIAHLGVENGVTHYNKPLAEWLDRPHHDRYQAVFHLASPVGVSVVEQLSQPDFEQWGLTNNKLIDWAAGHAENVCVSSSSEVYGDLNGEHGVDTMKEEAALDEFPIGKRWRYAVMKRKMEQYALQVFCDRPDDLFIARLFNVVGERQNPEQEMVLPTFIRAVRDDHPISIYGDGNQQRCFSDVLDVVRILAEATLSGSKPHVVMNVGSEHPLTLRSLAEKVNGIGRELGYSPVEIQFIRERNDEIFKRIPNTTRLKEWCGEVPEIDIKTVIKRVFKDQENRNADCENEVTV